MREFFCSLGLYDLYGKADRQVHHIERETHDEDAGEHQQARDKQANKHALGERELTPAVRHVSLDTACIVRAASTQPAKHINANASSIVR